MLQRQTERYLFPGVSPKLFPNPVVHTLTVGVPFAASEVTDSQVTDLTGRVHLLNAHAVDGKGGLLIHTGTLTKGCYLLKVNTHQGAVIAYFARQ